MIGKLKNDDELQWSAIVANNSMNRKRKATGINSYQKDIKLNPIEFISSKLLESKQDQIILVKLWSIQFMNQIMITKTKLNLYETTTPYPYFNHHYFL